MGRIKDALSKSERAFALLKLVMLALRNVDVKRIQTEYGYTKGRKVRVDILDSGRHFVFQIRSGKIDIIRMFAGKPDVQVVFGELCTLKHLRLGYKKGVSPGSGEPAAITYAPLTAWQMSDVRAHGDSSTNDILGVVKLFISMIATVDADEVVRIIGPCGHDIGVVAEEEPSSSLDGMVTPSGIRVIETPKNQEETPEPEEAEEHGK